MRSHAHISKRRQPKARSRKGFRYLRLGSLVVVNVTEAAAMLRSLFRRHLSVEEVADRLGCHISTIYRWCSRIASTGLDDPRFIYTHPTHELPHPVPDRSRDYPFQAFGFLIAQDPDKAFSQISFLFSVSQYCVREVAAVMGVSLRAIYRWIVRFEAAGYGDPRHGIRKYRRPVPPPHNHLPIPS